MNTVELKMAGVTVRILQGYENHVQTDHTTHNGQPALLLTFNPESRFQKCQRIIQDGQVWDAGGQRPHFLIGILHRGVHVNIQKVEIQDQSIAMAAG